MKKTIIEDNEFENRIDLRIYEVPDGVEEIGDAAFSGCENLKTINIPDSVVSIGDFAFNNCISLENVRMSKNAQMHAFSFQFCSSLKSIEIPKVVDGIGEYCFANCKNLENVKILGKKIERIYYSAFEGCEKLTTINLPNGLKEIQECAFFGCESLKKLYIPKSVKKIDNNVFEGCTNITLEVENGSYAEKYAIHHGIKYKTKSQKKDLTDEEIELLNNFKKLSEKDRKKLIEMSKILG